MLEDSKNFLLVSESYINSLGKSEKEKNILSRRAVVIKYLNSEYKLVRNSFSKIMNELKSMNIIVTVHTVKKDIEIYRLAHRFYHGEKEGILKRLENQKDFTIKPLKYLIADGFDSWEKIAKQFKDADAPVVKGAKKDKKKPPIKKEPEMLMDTDAKDNDVSDSVKGWLQKHFRQIQLLVIDLTKNNKSTKSALEKAVAASVRKDEEIKKLEAEIALLKKANLEARAQTKVSEHKFHEGNQLLELADADIKKLKEQNVSLRIEIREIQKEKQTLLNANNLARLEIEALRSRFESVVSEGEVSGEIVLPVKCESFGKPFEYSKDFLDTFNSLERGMQELIIEKVKFLSISGLSHRSLRSKAQNVDRGPLKKGEMRSYAGKFFRFTWEISEEAVHIIGLYWKKDLEG